MDELERLGLNDNFGLAYDNEMMQKKMINTARNWGYDDGKEAGKAEGKVEGIEEGAKAKEIEIAKNLLNKGISIDLVSESTGLSIEDLNNLLEDND